MTDQIVTPLERHSFYMLLFDFILRHDDHLRHDMIEAIRLILQNPISTDALSPVVRQLMQQTRDELLEPPQPEIASAMSQPPVRLVEKPEKKS